MFSLFFFTPTSSFRLIRSNETTSASPYFKPYDRGFVGIYGNALNYQRERINEGAFETEDQELLYEGNYPRQSCPSMVGPFSDGNFYCTAREFGICDRRSGICICNTGYQGIDCSDCSDSHYKVGNHCYPKKLCQNDCNGAGTCNYNNGTCTCLPHRTGETCETLLCSIYSPLCVGCNSKECLQCSGGYYLTGDSRVCSSCYDFDPRCSGCIKEEGCRECADSTLTSVRRSGYLLSDPSLPEEEEKREFSITIPFGSKSPEIFAESESYFVCTTPDKPLKDNALTCSQGETGDDSWSCTNYPISHIVCGHYGTFSFLYPNYEISEDSNYIRMYVQRTGGGYGNVSVNYYIKHITTDENDVVVTAPYTTVQQLDFPHGVVQKSFLINILNDNLVEENEVFQVILETPEGGAALGPQFRTNITIIDDDIDSISAEYCTISTNYIQTLANESFSLIIHSAKGDGHPLSVGGGYFYAVLENYLDSWNSPSENPLGGNSQIIDYDKIIIKNDYDNSEDTVDKIYSGVGSLWGGGQSQGTRKVCKVSDLGDGDYEVFCSGIPYQGLFQLRLFQAFPNSIMGEYYSDSYFTSMYYRRLDMSINFDWGSGKLLPFGSDFVSIRWTGLINVSPLFGGGGKGTYYVFVDADDHVRLWIDGNLIIDHFHERGLEDEFPYEIYLSGDDVFDSFHEIVVEYREIEGEAHCKLKWQLPGQTELQVIPQTALFSMFPLGVPSSNFKKNIPDAFQATTYPGLVNVRVYSNVASAENTECYGQGLFSGESTIESTFTICPRDEFGNLKDDPFFNIPTFNTSSSNFIRQANESAYFTLSSELFSSYLKLIEDHPDTIKYNGVGSDIITPILTFNRKTLCFDAKYTPEKAGMYELHVNYKSSPDQIPSEVAGSPFHVSVIPTTASGKHSKVIGLDNPLNLEAGKCNFFNITLRDFSSNLILKGGDIIEAYMFRVDYYNTTTGINPNLSLSPTFSPSIAPTTSSSTVIYDKISDSGADIVRFGTVVDHNNGDYSVLLCPVIQGIYEIHLLLGGEGVSNQNIRILDPINSLLEPSGFGSHKGYYIDNSPYSLIVRHTKPSIISTTVQMNDDLKLGTVGILNKFLVTVRDPYDNVVRTPNYPLFLTMDLDVYPSATNLDYVNLAAIDRIQWGINEGQQQYGIDPVFTLPNTVTDTPCWNFHNGSFLCSFIPKVSGINYLSIYIDGFRTIESPFTLNITSGQSFGSTSYALGPGLISTQVNIPTFYKIYAFDNQNNRKLDFNDNFASVLFFQGKDPEIIYSKPCTETPIYTESICTEEDLLGGVYYVEYIPHTSGELDIQVYLVPEDETRRLQVSWTPPAAWQQIGNSPFKVIVQSGESDSGNVDIGGDIYENEAGQIGEIDIQLRDNNGNPLVNGGSYLELVAYCVATDFGIVDNHLYDLTPNKNLRKDDDNNYFMTDFKYYYENFNNFINSDSLVSAIENVKKLFSLETLWKKFYSEDNTSKNSLWISNDKSIVFSSVGKPRFDTYEKKLLVPTVNKLLYRGFYAQDQPIVFGKVFDYNNGAYKINYLIHTSGQYVLRLSLLMSKLNVTYFNTIDFDNELGQDFQWNGNTFYHSRTMLPIENKQDISDTDYYFKKFMLTEKVNIPSLNINSTHFSVGTNSEDDEYRFVLRNEYFSVRYYGLILPVYNETYKFTVITNHLSDVQLFINNPKINFQRHDFVNPLINYTSPDRLIDNRNVDKDNNDLFVTTNIDSKIKNNVGTFTFTSLEPYPFMLEYVHYRGESQIDLYWESISTPFQKIPSSQFFHWENVTHSNLTITPTHTLCPKCSTVVGNGLYSAVVGRKEKLSLYLRDQFGNLLRTGGKSVRVIALPNHISNYYPRSNEPVSNFNKSIIYNRLQNAYSIRAKVDDHGNSTYSLTYTPIISGNYSLYISAGTPSNLDNSLNDLSYPLTPTGLHSAGLTSTQLGYHLEALNSKDYWVAGAPFLLTVKSLPPSISHSIAHGKSLHEGFAGELQKFEIFMLDKFLNPAYFENIDIQNIKSNVKLSFHFTRADNNDIVNPNIFNWSVERRINNGQSQDIILVEYQINRAYDYNLRIRMFYSDSHDVVPSITDYIDVNGSPFFLRISHSQYPDPKQVVVRGLGLRQGYTDTLTTFLITLQDQFKNKYLRNNNKFYIRLYSEEDYNNIISNSNNPPIFTTNFFNIPNYYDHNNGNYTVSYKVSIKGTKRMIVKLLGTTSSSSSYLDYSSPLGDGLLGQYFSSSNLNEENESIIKVEEINSLNSLTLNINKNGEILYNNNSSSFYCNSIQWIGYLVTPMNDTISLVLPTSDLFDYYEGRIYLDNLLVFSSSNNYRQLVKVGVNHAYQIRIVLSQLDSVKIARNNANIKVGTSDEATNLNEFFPTYLSLHWKTSRDVSSHVISPDYLYSIANDIPFSPFKTVIY